MTSKHNRNLNFAIQMKNMQTNLTIQIQMKNMKTNLTMICCPLPVMG